MSNYKTEEVSLDLICETSKDPRYYQARSVKELYQNLEEGFTRICIKMPTGCGKTYTSKLVALSTDIREFLDIKPTQKARVLYITTKNRLGRQAIEEYKENDSHVELIWQSAFAKVPQKVMEEGWDFTIIDECHHEAMMSIQQMLETLSAKPIFGMTAEDRRGDLSLIKFERVIVAISEYEASEMGFIEKVGINSVIDLSGLKKDELAGNLIENYHKHMGNSLVFFKTSNECESLLTKLTELNIPAEMLTSGMTELEMDAALDRLSNSEIRFLINCQKLGEGVDIPNCTDVILARQFNSLAEKKQYVGRAIRPDSRCAVWEFINPVKDAVLAVDVVGHTKYERFLHCRKGVWHEDLISGTDEGWGKFGEEFKPKLEREAGQESAIDIMDLLKPEKPELSTQEKPVIPTAEKPRLRPTYTESGLSY